MNCTFVGNVAEFSVGGVSSGVHTNAIVWNNPPSSSDSSAVLRFSNVDGAASGPGNISADPLFFGPAGSDVHLMGLSPCIDAGDPMSPPDPDGSRSDMGAFPFDPAWTFTPGVYCLASPGSLKCLPSIAIVGEPSLGSGPPVQLLARDLPPSTFGLMVYSTSSALTQVNVTSFETATLCVGSPLIRGQVQQSSPGSGDCSGELSDDLSSSELLAFGIQPDDRVYAQFWFRLAFGRFGLTDAAEMIVRN